MTKLEKLCIKWLNENFNPMEPFYMEEYPDYIFHMKDGKCILQHNKKNGYVYVSYGEIWKFFESYFSMSNQQIKDITKIWVEEQYKMGVITTFRLKVCEARLVEEQYKMGVITTEPLLSFLKTWVEEHYKMGVTTTLPNSFYRHTKVEEHYKVGVTSIGGLPLGITKEVEEQYQEIQTTNNQLEFYDEKDVNELYEQNTNE